MDHAARPDVSTIFTITVWRDGPIHYDLRKLLIKRENLEFEVGWHDACLRHAPSQSFSEAPQMIQLSKTLAIASVVAITAFVAPKPAEAALISYICNDQSCSGGNDQVLVDVDGDGIVFLQGSFFGFSVTSNISQSKPNLAQGMDLNYAVSSGQGPGGTLWLYAFDDNFVGPASLSAFIGGTNDVGGSTLAGICANAGGGFVGGFGAGCVSAFSGATGAFALSMGPLNAPFNPYDALLGVSVTISGSGKTATGDLRMNNVPEPSILALGGLALLGLGLTRRRTKV